MNDANNNPDMADKADKSDRWTVRGIGADTRRKAADMAAKSDMPLGRWLSRLIEQAADKSDMADVPADALGPVLERLERLERAVFVADMADKSDTGATVTVVLDMADMADMADIKQAVAVTPNAAVTADMSDTADINSTEPPCLTRSSESDTRTPLEAAGVPAGVVDAAGAGSGADDSTDVPGGAGVHSSADMAGTADTESSAALCRTAADKSDSDMPVCGAIAVQTRLSGDAKAERAADIKRQLGAGESKSEIITALGISLATLNRALAE